MNKRHLVRRYVSTHINDECEKMISKIETKCKRRVREKKKNEVKMTDETNE